MRRVAHIALKEFSPFGKIFVPVYQIVDGYRVQPLFGQFFAAMGTDIPGPAGYQNVHGLTLKSD